MAYLDETGLAALWQDVKAVAGKLTGESDGAVRGGIAGLTAKGHAEQASTTGKNLLDESLLTDTLAWAYMSVQLLPNTTYIGSSPDAPDSYVDSTAPSLYMMDVLSSADRVNVVNSSHQSIITTNETGIVKVQWRNKSSTDNLTNYHFQLELGSTATEYEPYSGGAPSPSPDYPQEIQTITGHEVTGKTGRFVDLEVRDANDQLLSATPIPLPSRGWVAGLPDGTADSLRLDGAGKCEWTLPTGEVVLDGSENWNKSSSMFITPIPEVSTSIPLLTNYFTTAYMPQVRDWDAIDQYKTVMREGVQLVNVMTLSINDPSHSSASDFSTWLSTHPVTVLFPLATPIIEDCGYVEDWPTDIPEGATITIPELDEVSIRYFVDSAVTELARQWYARANSEYADRITALEQAVAELATS